VQYQPIDTMGLNASASVGREKRPDSAFGLQDNDLNGFTVGADYTPTPAVVAGLSYSFENSSTSQRSRQANPQPDPTFSDARRDWMTDMDEDVHTVSASLDLPNIAPRTGLQFRFDTVHSNAQYIYTLAPDSTLPPVRQLPGIKNRFDVLTADVRYILTRQLAVGGGYRFDHFNTDDFALNPDIMNTALIPAYVNLRYQWRPYRVHTGFVRLMYSW
jgi:opacity protein-like surface antigen